jgi:hypothetical protein
LRLLEEQDELRALRLGEIRGKIAAGLVALDRGEGIDSGSALEQLRRKAKSRRK